ncbi:MAG: FMN-binding negative transcriptional regulator [Planctomycetes bacterium]|nr:FMN-binding negative transcriptional regulator [Planctomycetota bacterium]
MYIPDHFAETDQAKLFAFIEQHSFGLLTSQLDGGLMASHLPLLLDRAAGPHGTLIGHMARANPHWRADGAEMLAVFSGPHAYISPAWYQAERVVPTWNYAAVHAYGRFERIDDPAQTVQIVRDYVAFYERSYERPWQVPASETEFIEQMARGVVAFRIPITRLEGKWKLNQNHSRERRERVIVALQAQGDENSIAVARLMEETLDSK